MKLHSFSRLGLLEALGYVRPPQREVNITNDEPLPRRILFLFPTRPESFAESRYVLSRLEQHIAQGSVLLAIPNIYRDQIPKPAHPTFFFPVTRHRPPRVQRDVLLARFRREEYDAVVNLDPHLDLPMARIVSVVTAPRKIGFQGPGADQLYNIQISPSSTRGGASDPRTEKRVRKDASASSDEGDAKPEGGHGRLTGAYDQMLMLCDLGPIAEHPDYRLW